MTKFYINQLISIIICTVFLYTSYTICNWYTHNCFLGAFPWVCPFGGFDFH